MIDWQNWLDEKLEEQNERLSHFESDAYTFHPSQLSKCKRQCYISKLGLVEHEPETLRIFEMGNIIHEYLQDLIRESESFERFEIEKDLQVEIPSTRDITLTGHCDLFDNELNIVYDFKTRGSWYNFEPPVKRHMIQISLYQYMLWRQMIQNNDSFDEKDSIYGQIVYINKKNMEIKQEPKDTFEVFNPQIDESHVMLAKNALKKAHKIGDSIETNGIPNSTSCIPFDKCGCWLCNNEHKKKFTYEHLRND